MATYGDGFAAMVKLTNDVPGVSWSQDCLIFVRKRDCEPVFFPFYDDFLWKCLLANGMG